MIKAITQHIRQSLNLQDILKITVADVQEFLQVDRVLIYQFESDLSGVFTIESVVSNDLSVLGKTLKDPCFEHRYIERYKQGYVSIVHDIYTAGLSECHIEMLRQFQVKANLVFPVLLKEQIWGLLIAHHCRTSRQWQPFEIELLRQLTTQIAIAIQQAQQPYQIPQQNAGLDHQDKTQIAQLKLAFEFEATLKQITDKVRDSLNEDQVMQTVVDELANVLDIRFCNATLYNLEKNIAVANSEYTSLLSSSKRRTNDLSTCPEFYSRLLQGEGLQFCSIIPSPDRRQATILAHPIQDDQGVLGSLWLISKGYYVFDSHDVELIQQVATQCAIALRQARRYQVVQNQVEELVRLNRLKDDFLSTVSHELRTPISNIKMATKMLEICLQRTNVLNQDTNSLLRYFQILKEEGQREIDLINDLFDLTQLDSSTKSLTLTNVSLQHWIPHILKPFIERIQKQQQRLELNIPVSLPTLTTDLDYLQTILTELLNNACKYTPQGETIAVSASTSVSTLGEAVQIQVCNSGVEIPEHERDRIFDKFYRLPNHDPWQQGGTGLGLTLVRKRVEQLQGTVVAMAEPGWTLFVVTLPLQIHSPS